MNSNVLKGIIVANGDTQSDLAKKLNMSQPCLNRKINHPESNEFTQSEMDAIRNIYTMSDDDFMRCFFR